MALSIKPDSIRLYRTSVSVLSLTLAFPVCGTELENVPRSVQRKTPSLKWGGGVGIPTAMMTESGAWAAASAGCDRLVHLTIWLFPGTSQREGIPSLPKGKIKQHMRPGGVGKTGTGGRESWPLPLALFLTPSESFHW